jgi:peptidoglycan/xylan/chitin deacetylase (PgdA/CDA1 family)
MVLIVLYLCKMYLVKIPWLIRKWYADFYWQMPVQGKNMYLTFDDGPHPFATPFVLQQLKRFGAKASFFCVGNNVKLYPELVKQIRDEGHRLANHTMNHVNGWKVDDEHYLSDVLAAAELLPTGWFRPPYGRIRRSQFRKLSAVLPGIRVMMWDVLSGDFDQRLKGDTCANNVINHAGPGSVVVFHDSTRAWERLEIALPQVLDHFSREGYVFHALPDAALMNQ